MKKILFIFIYTFAFAILGKFIYSEIKEIQESNKNPIPYSKALKIHQENVKELAEAYDLPASYLMALIMLESSGKDKTPVRFEKSIYKRLLNLKKGKIEKFENLTIKDVENLSKKQLKALSSSYGPFQIMGYKCFILDIPLKDLTGKKNMRYAVKWIDLTYGDYLRKGNFRDAFHIHNTGEKHPVKGKPKTYDPDYVKNGLEYEKYFRKVFR